VGRILDVYAALDGAVTSHYEVTTHPEIFDGVRLHKSQSVAVIRHNARVILSCERVILNFLQRMSGIATLTRKFVEAVSGTKARILDTRKTAPGLRVIDKYAVRCGGGQNHRLDLSDGVLIKNNHIVLAGGIAPALERAHRNRRGSQPIELEVRTAQELEDAIAHGAEAVLLDNMSVAEVSRAVERCGKIERRIPLECSGGIRLENVRAYAETGVDFISIGLLTHSTHAADMSMRVIPA
jgi:nicotinate-nucleotide pyrophosphorylase (carboxylating)